MLNPVTTDCPRCSQRLRIASARVPKAGQTLGLVCPRCRERWRWSPVASASMRELAFRCAYSQDEFSVLYAKEARDTKFRLRAIEETGRVIKRLLSSTNVARVAKAHIASPVSSGSWAAIDFDHSGWRCPHCRKRGVETNTFIKCGNCNGLVCGASMIQVHGGGRTFRCTCGAHAEVTEGLIASFDGKTSDLAFHPRAATAPELPPHQRPDALGAGRVAELPSGAQRSLWQRLPWRQKK